MTGREPNILMLQKNTYNPYHKMPKASKTKKITTAPKICLVCKRPFTWRKKWESVWEEVKYCSDQCRTKKKNKND
jgi:hypothetical protein